MIEEILLKNISKVFQQVTKENAESEELLKLMQENADHIFRLCEYILFGILVSIFYYGKGFIIKHKCLTKWTVFFVIISLILMFCQIGYMFESSKDLYSGDKSENDIDYIHASEISIKMLWGVVGTTVLSVIFFLVNSWKYFFVYEETVKSSQCSCDKNHS